ncbi:helix-turn-helix transcriptional regulator, partial [Citrobacter freundii]
KRAYCLKTQPATGETYPKSDLFNKAGRTLNYTEMILLKRFVSGKSIQQITQIDNIDIKKIYVYKLRLEDKLGHSIHKILSNIL